MVPIVVNVKGFVGNEMIIFAVKYTRICAHPRITCYCIGIDGCVDQVRERRNLNVCPPTTLSVHAGTVDVSLDSTYA